MGDADVYVSVRIEALPLDHNALKVVVVGLMVMG